MIYRTLAQNVTLRFSAEYLCSAENRAQCMKRLLEMPNIKNYVSTSEKFAAVLVPLCIHEDRLSLLYTVRSANLNRHSNEVSFPGGMRDDTDDTYTSCALREANEECGIRPDQVYVYIYSFQIHIYYYINIIHIIYRSGVKPNYSYLVRD